jgi:hypothetical protein
MPKKIKKEAADEPKEPLVYGDPEYSSADDIYSKSVKKQLSDSKEDAQSEKGQTGDILTGEDLDVPGAELDDSDEEIGEEDEENNYYSLGGDDHNDLEEDRGD